MGSRGPVPNHSDDLARPRERKGGDQQAITKGIAKPSTPYEADETWHSIAKQLWQACLESGQSSFYQQSDWAILYSLCEDLSLYKSSLRRSGQMLQTIMSQLGDLLLTEGQRRRVRIELDEPPSEQKSAELYAIEEYRAELDDD